MSLTQGKCRVFTTERTKLKHIVRELKENAFEPEGKQESVKAIGFRSNYLVDVKTTTGSKYLVSIPSKLRNRIWIQNGQYLIVDPIAEGKKVKAEVAHVLFPDHVSHLQSDNQWPKAFNPPFPCRYKEIRARIDEKLKEEERRVEAEEDTCAAARCSDSESEEDDESNLFVNVNRQYLYGPPIVRDASDDELEEEDSEEEDEEGEDEEEGEGDSHPIVKSVV